MYTHKYTQIYTYITDVPLFLGEKLILRVVNVACSHVSRMSQSWN